MMNLIESPEVMGPLLLAILGGFGWLAKKYLFDSDQDEPKPEQSQNQTTTINQTFTEQTPGRAKVSKRKFKTIEDAKKQARFVFIDDDTRFKHVKIFKQAGWENVEIIKDVGNLDENPLRAADLVFVDIQGVGKIMNFSDEGLGLAKAIVERYPEKYLVIYSAEQDGNRFHDAIRRADDQLYKHADFYEFEKCVYNLVVEE